MSFEIGRWRGALPVADAVPELRAALTGARAAVLEAPPGAGKTTLVPLALLDDAWLGGGRILMLEPRRPPARAAGRPPPPPRHTRRPEDAHRSPDRRHPASHAAERSGARGHRPRRVRRVPRAQ